MYKVVFTCHNEERFLLNVYKREVEMLTLSEQTAKLLIQAPEIRRKIGNIYEILNYKTNTKTTKNKT